MQGSAGALSLGRSPSDIGALVLNSSIKCGYSMALEDQNRRPADERFRVRVTQCVHCTVPSPVEELVEVADRGSARVACRPLLRFLHPERLASSTRDASFGADRLLTTFATMGGGARLERATSWCKAGASVVRALLGHGGRAAGLSHPFEPAAAMAPLSAAGRRVRSPAPMVPSPTSRRLRELIDRSPEAGPVVVPGAYDALSARLIELAGFAAVYMTGFGASASLLGRPDIGLLTGAEMAAQARRIVAAVDVPVVADADTGYGNAINVARTVAMYEQAGVAAIQLEDQVSPKRCGHMSGKSVVTPDEMVGKLRAAVDARRDPDVVLIARTDAIAVEGVEAALERARAYREAGADALFVEAPTSEAEIEEVAAELADEMPLVFNWIEGGRTPPLSLQRIAELGFALVLFPIGALLAATAGVRSLLAEVAAAGTPASALPRLPGFDEFTDLLGLPEVRELERRYE
jgi:2-methylisocitrate lyase-like PEP mutase family enzyme